MCGRDRGLEAHRNFHNICCKGNVQLLFLECRGRPIMNFEIVLYNMNAKMEYQIGCHNSVYILFFRKRIIKLRSIQQSNTFINSHFRFGVYCFISLCFLAHVAISQHELLPSLGVRRLLTFSNINFPETTGQNLMKLGMIVPQGTLHKMTVGIFYPLKNMAAVTKNRTQGTKDSFC